MRKCEQKMIQMIKAHKVGAVNDNTFVDFIPVAGVMGNDPNKIVAEVVLYSTTIARLWIDQATNTVEAHELDHGGYTSNTTKSRMNALIEGFNLEGGKVYQKDFVWYRNGKAM